MTKSAPELFTESVEFQRKENYPAAIELLNEVLIKEPNFAPAWNNRGSMLQAVGHPFDAALSYEKAIACAPGEASHYNNLGAAYADMEQWFKAMEMYDTALSIDPKLATSYNNKANVLCMRKRLPEAIKELRKALEADPKYVDAHVGLALTLLKNGQFEEGWKEYEWRWQMNQMKPRPFKFDRWTGDPGTPEDALLLVGEQGFGDDLMSMRFATIVKELGWKGKVYVEVRQPLVRIAETLDGVDGVFALGCKIPVDVTRWLPMLSIPTALWGKLPVEVGSAVQPPYFRADTYLADIWRDKLRNLPPGLLVGICWAGMNREKMQWAAAIDKRRSMALEDFAPLARLSGISWVSLVIGPNVKHLTHSPPGMIIGDWSAEIYDFYDTAALISCLDLVITVDTAIAHIAGALGKPVWMLSRYDGCWRWLMDKETTSWYPSMKIFNQTEPGNWDVPLAKMVPQLAQLARAAKAQRAAA